MVNVNSQIDFSSLQHSEPLTPVGTPDYMAPEVLLTSEHTEAVDFWSLGALLFELVTGIPPFHSDTQEETFKRILKLDVDWSLLPMKSNKRSKTSEETVPNTIRLNDLEIPEQSVFKRVEVDDESDDSENYETDTFSPELIDLIKKLLVLDPSKRLRIDEIYAHPWFKGINWDDLSKSEDFDAPFIPDVNDPTGTNTEYFSERNEFKDKYIQIEFDPGGRQLVSSCGKMKSFTRS